MELISDLSLINKFMPHINLTVHAQSPIDLLMSRKVIFPHTACKILQREDLTLELLLKFMDMFEDNVNVMELIFGNKLITWEFIKSKLTNSIYYRSMGRNPNVSMDIIMESHMNYIQMTGKDTPEMGLIKTDKGDIQFPWESYEISRNPNIRANHIREFNFIHWDMQEVAMNPGIKWEDIINMNLDIDSVSCNPNITPKCLRERPDWKWNMRNIVKYNKTFTWENLSWYHSKKWISKILLIDICKHPTLTWDDIINSPTLNWTANKCHLINREFITIDIIKNHFMGYIGYITTNPNMTIDFLLSIGEFLNEYAATNKCITWEFIKTNKGFDGKGWDYNIISLNPNISWDIIYNTRKRRFDIFRLTKGIDWNFSLIAENTFNERRYVKIGNNYIEYQYYKRLIRMNLRKICPYDIVDVINSFI